MTLVCDRSPSDVQCYAEHSSGPESVTVKLSNTFMSSEILPQFYTPKVNMTGVNKANAKHSDKKYLYM